MRSWKRPIVGLVIGASLLAGCATGSSSSCPPVVEYTKEQLQAAALGVEALPDGSILIDMLADYSVLRAQARLCRGR
jgi:hypothetical protein